jgi:ribosomal protein S18 acetylase RimI-like enzyme
VRIRRARLHELETIGAVTLAAYAPFVSGTEDAYADHLRDAAGRDREAELWVATPDDDDQILGTVTTCPVGSPWREIGGPDEGEFRMLAVAPEAQGQGVGDALVGHVLAVSRERGDRAVVLSTLADMVAAHRVYARHGFRRTPERDWSPMPGVDLITFRGDLDDLGDLEETR